jgi:hypothetical protein
VSYDEPGPLCWSVDAPVIVVLGLALYRKFVSTHGDNYVHMSQGEARLIPQQMGVNQKIDKIDHWGEFLTIGALVAGLGLACIYVYSALNAR